MTRSINTSRRSWRSSRSMVAWGMGAGGCTPRVLLASAEERSGPEPFNSSWRKGLKKPALRPMLSSACIRPRLAEVRPTPTLVGTISTTWLSGLLAVDVMRGLLQALTGFLGDLTFFVRGYHPDLTATGIDTAFAPADSFNIGGAIKL